jgi:hypothetical protein
MILVGKVERREEKRRSTRGGSDEASNSQKGKIKKP